MYIGSTTTAYGQPFNNPGSWRCLTQSGLLRLTFALIRQLYPLTAFQAPRGARQCTFARRIFKSERVFKSPCGQASDSHALVGVRTLQPQIMPCVVRRKQRASPLSSQADAWIGAVVFVRVTDDIYIGGSRGYYKNPNSTIKHLSR